MLFLAESLAIFKRLTGYPLDSAGRPRIDPKTALPVNRHLIGPPDLNMVDRQWDELRSEWIEIAPRMPSFGVRIPMAASGNSGRRPAATDDPGARLSTTGYAPNSFQQVPVFEMNSTGRKWEHVYPCVTFRWTTFAAGRDVPYHEPFIEYDPSEQLVVLDEDGETLSQGSRYGLVRPSPAQVNVTFMITCWATNNADLGLLCREVMELFPAKTALYVEHQNGVEHATDMIFDRAVSYDEGGDLVVATQTPEGIAPLARAFYFTVESYLDNTTNEYGVQGHTSAAQRQRTILETIVEISNLQNTLVMETFDITAEAP